MKRAPSNRSETTLSSLVVRAALSATVLLGAASAAFAAPPGARDTAVERAEALAARAFEAYLHKDYAAAVDTYRRAYDVVPAPDIVFNLARIYDLGLHDPARAIEHYRRYVADPDADGARVELAWERLALLTATEQSPIERSALRPQRREPSAPALETPRLDMRAIEPTPPAAGASRPVVRDLVAPAASKADAGADAEPVAWTPLRVGALVAGTVGLVGVGLGAGFGVAALSDAGTARQYCDGDLCRSQRGVDATHAAAKNADIATVSFALGGSLLGASVALFWLDSDRRAAGGELGGARVVPVIAESELGVALSGRW